MVKGLYTAYTGMINEQHRMDTIANNMANVTTTGYKKEGATSQSFDSILAVKIKDSSVGYNIVQPEGMMQPGVKIGENYTDWSSGSFKITENDLDLAIAGDGFFAIEFTSKSGETKTMYTRDGGFMLNSDGYIVNSNGDYLLDENSKRIQISPSLDTTIDRTGNIIQDMKVVGKIGIVDFENYDYLQKYGENYYYALEGAKFVETKPDIYSGYLETSNVNVVTEMVDLITISRQYESNQKIISTIDSTLDVAVNQIGKL